MSLVFNQGGVEGVEEPGGRGGVARRCADQVALARGAGGNGAEVVRAGIEPLLNLRFDARAGFRVGGAEPHALERPAEGGDGQPGGESREDDPAERRGFQHDKTAYNGQTLIAEAAVDEIVRLKLLLKRGALLGSLNRRSSRFSSSPP